MSSRTLLIVALVVTGLAEVAVSCCMVPRDFRGRISQRAQEAVIIHHEGRQELILGIDYQISGADVMPGQFAWIITVPASAILAACLYAGLRLL